MYICTYVYICIYIYTFIYLPIYLFAHYLFLHLYSPRSRQNPSASSAKTAPARRRAESAAPQARRCLAAGGSHRPPLGSWYPQIKVDIAVETHETLSQNDQQLGFPHPTVGLPEANQIAHVSHPFWGNDVAFMI